MKPRKRAFATIFLFNLNIKELIHVVVHAQGLLHEISLGQTQISLGSLLEKG
jgi:hypothetical protein